MTYFDETGSVPDYKVVHDPIPDGAYFGVEITHARWRGSELLIHWFPIPPFEGPKREGWTVIGELEFQDPKICEYTVLGYKGGYSKLWNKYIHWYGLGTPYGISDYTVHACVNYTPIIEMIKELVGLNDDDYVDEYCGSALFRRKAESTLARFKGQKGWFNIL